MVFYIHYVSIVNGNLKMFFRSNCCFLFAVVTFLFSTSQLFSTPTETEVVDYFTTHYQISSLDEVAKANLLTLSDQEWISFKKVFSMNSNEQISNQCRAQLVLGVSQVPAEKRECVYDSVNKLLMATRETLQINEPRGLEVFIQQIMEFNRPEDISNFTERVIESVRKSSPKQNDNYFILQIYQAWCQIIGVEDDEKRAIFECTREDLDAVIQEERELGLIADAQFLARKKMLTAVFDANEEIKRANAYRKRGRSVVAAVRDDNS